MKSVVAAILPFLVLSASAQYRGGNGDGTSFNITGVQNQLQNIYAGGINDGIGKGGTAGQNQLNNIYAGANNDGFGAALTSGQNLVSNIYAGGFNDGFAVNQNNNQNSLLNIYSGGNNDGFAFAKINALNPLTNIYWGGSNDGSAINNSTGLNFLANIYSGGIQDGYASVKINNLNPLVTLPIKLLNFTGVWQQNNINLNWHTSSEINCDHFELERSINNGNNFTFLINVNTIGNNNSVSAYQFSDRQVPNGNIFYYRLKIVDKDGNFYYSAILRFTRDNNETYTIYPNPGKGIFNISLNGISDLKNYSYRVLNSAGLQIARDAIVATNTQFDITNMPAGNYVVELIKKEKIINAYIIIKN